MPVHPHCTLHFRKAAAPQPTHSQLRKDKDLGRHRKDIFCSSKHLPSSISPQVGTSITHFRLSHPTH